MGNHPKGPGQEVDELEPHEVRENQVQGAAPGLEQPLPSVQAGQ